MNFVSDALYKVGLVLNRGFTPGFSPSFSQKNYSPSPPPPGRTRTGVGYENVGNLSMLDNEAT